MPGPRWLPRRALQTLVFGAVEPSDPDDSSDEDARPHSAAAEGKNDHHHLDFLGLCLAVNRSRGERKGSGISSQSPSNTTASPTPTQTPRLTSPVSPIVSLFDVAVEAPVDTVVLGVPHPPTTLPRLGTRSPRPLSYRALESETRVAARWLAVDQLLKGLPTLRKATLTMGRDAERLEALLEPSPSQGGEQQSSTKRPSPRHNRAASQTRFWVPEELAHVVGANGSTVTSEPLDGSPIGSPCLRDGAPSRRWEEGNNLAFGVQLLPTESGRLFLSAVLVPPKSSELESSTASNLSAGKAGLSSSGRGRSPGSSTASYIPCAILSTLADVYYRICVNRQQKPMPSFLRSLLAFRLGDFAAQDEAESQRSSQSPSRETSVGAFTPRFTSEGSTGQVGADLLCRSFTVLDLSRFCAGPKGTFAALGILFHTPNVQRISLAGCGIDTNTVEFLCLIAALGLPKLRELDLRDNPGLDFAAGGHLQRLVARPLPALVAVFLDGTNVRPSTKRSIESHLKGRQRPRQAVGGTARSSYAFARTLSASKTTVAMEESTTSSAADPQNTPHQNILPADTDSATSLAAAPSEP